MEPVARLQNGHSKSPYSTSVSGAFGVAPDVVAIRIDVAKQRGAHRNRRTEPVGDAEPSPSRRQTPAPTPPARRRGPGPASTGSVIAMSTMNSEMVNPMPDSAAPPATRRNVSPGARLTDAGGAHQRGRPGDADELADHQTGDHSPRQRRAHRVRRAVAPSRRTPAFASANSGSTTNDTYGPNPVCRRSLIEIDSRRLRVAARAYSEFGDCRKARITSTASSTRCRSGVNTGISSATATPASVGCTPPEEQRQPQPERQHRSRRARDPMGSSRTAAMAAISTTAISSGDDPDVVGVEQRDRQQRADVVDDRQGEQEGAQPRRVLADR